jgi:serine/threonine protein phosphatase PrpC
VFFFWDGKKKKTPLVALTRLFDAKKKKNQQSAEMDVTLSGTTCVVAYIDGSNVVIANCGDSRCIVGYLDDDEVGQIPRCVSHF